MNVKSQLLNMMGKAWIRIRIEKETKAETNYSLMNPPLLTGTSAGPEIKQTRI